MALSIPHDLDAVKVQEFKNLQSEGKRLASEGKLIESLNLFELACKICETPKLLQRIEILKGAINKSSLAAKSKSASQNYKENISKTSNNFSSEGNKLSHEVNQNQKEVHSALHEIQNLEKATGDNKAKTLSDLSPISMQKFKDLKKTAFELSYDGKFEAALENFKKALEIYDCPRIKEFIREIETAVSKRARDLDEFHNLTEIGKKLAAEGKPQESLKKLKDAFAVCPSPKVSKMIKALEVVKDSTSAENDTAEQCLSSTSEDDLKANQTAVSVKAHSIHEKTDVSSNIRNCDPSSLNPEQIAELKYFYKKSREHAAEGELKKALDYMKKAKSICETEKVLKRIKDIEEHIKISEIADDNSEDDEKMIKIADDFYVYHEIYEKLYPYQRFGVAWMWELHNKSRGGVLGDDMGLGKTFQVIAFLSGLIDANLIKYILIIMPVSLLPNWKKEFNKWCPGISVHDFHGAKKEREKNLFRVQRRGHVLLTSYGMVVGNLSSLTELDGRKFVWDYLILDEGHKIKNPTKTTKAVHDIPAKHRLVLTGTPIQNNLRELWALYDFVHQGTLLGSLKTFKMQYENTITRSREKDATIGEKRLGTEMAENLKKLIKPYFLRRTKVDVWGTPNANTNIDVIAKKLENLEISNKLETRKNDLILWLYMSDPQIEIYKSFLHSNAVKTILVSKRSPLVELTTLKKICDHPRLLSQRACLQLGLNGELKEEDLLRELADESTTAASIENISDETLINESGKLKFLLRLLENLRETGHRTLVFSLSRKILDMVHRILVNRKWKVMRVDGTITKMEERERRIQIFQNDTSYPVFLLTTQVGGVGITLTAADRVVIYDPSWNPATDAQAVDRAYRIGQKKDVVVYRLITCGTVEEKIYRRQIFKDSITKQATCTSDPYRYFSKQELRELFSLDNPHYSATQVQLSAMHSSERVTDVYLDEHIAFLYSLDIFGISDHDLMFTKDIEDHAEDNDESAVSNDYIKKQVAAAQQLIQAEASVVEEGMRLAGSYSKPFLESIPTFKKSSVKDNYKPPLLPDIPQINSENAILQSTEFEDVFIIDNETNTPNVKKKLSQKGDESPKFRISENTNAKQSFEYAEREKNKITSYFSAAESETQNTSMNVKQHSFDEKTDSASCSEKLSSQCMDDENNQTDGSGTAESESNEKSLAGLQSKLSKSLKNAQTPNSKLLVEKSPTPEVPIKSVENSYHDYSTESNKNTSSSSGSSSHQERSPEPEILTKNVENSYHGYYTEEKTTSSSRGPSSYHTRSPEPEILPKTVENSYNEEYREPEKNTSLSSGPSSNQNSYTDSDADSIKTSSPILPKKSDFQNGITILLSESLNELSFDEQPGKLSRKSCRKSCARSSAILIPDSDSSQKTSNASSANTSATRIEDSGDLSDSKEDSSNTASSRDIDSSVLLVPSSIPNSPSMHDNNRLVMNSNSMLDRAQMAFANEKTGTPHRTLLHNLTMDEMSQNLTHNDLSKKSEGSIKRITPLRVDRTRQCEQDLSFVKALAASPVIDLQTSDILHTSKMRVDSSIIPTVFKDDEDDESPIQMKKKKNRKIIASESEDSDDENYKTRISKTLHNASNIDAHTSFEKQVRSITTTESDDSNSEGESLQLEKTLDNVSDSMVGYGSFNESSVFRNTINESGNIFSQNESYTSEQSSSSDDC